MRAFVLSGGASLGAIQVGMLHALFERGVAPDLIVGTSAGAVNAAFVASREPTVEPAEALAKVWRGLRRGAVFPANPLTGFVGFIGRSDHLVPDGNLRRIIARKLEFELLEEAPTPLHVIATDVVSGMEMRLSSGSAVDAVLASAALPGVFKPVPWNGRRLMDGGVADNTPISQAVELGADEIYVLPTGYACALDEPPRGALAMFLHAMSLLVQQRMRVEIELMQDRARLIVLPPPCPQDVQPIDFSKADQLVEQGLAASRAFLESIAADRSPRGGLAAAERLVPHRH